jgi:hypothetical protein
VRERGRDQTAHGAPETVGVTRRMLRLVQMCALAVLILWAIYAPVHSYNQGRLVGYREGVTETLAKIVKSWPLVPLTDRAGRHL